MNGIMGLLLGTAESTTAAEETIAPIVTQYTDRTIPALTIAMIIVSAVLMIAFAVGVYVLFKRRGDHYGFGVIMGIIIYMVAVYILQTATSWGITKIWGEDYVTAHSTQISLIMTAASMVYECIGIFVGMRLAFNSNIKRNLDFDISTAIFFGFGYYVAYLLLSNTLLYSYQYAMSSIAINQMGFDPAVTALVQNGQTEEEAIQTILQLCDQNPFVYIFDALASMLKAVVVAGSCGLFYGVMKQKLSKAWLAAGFGSVLIIYIPSFIGVFVTIPDWAGFLLVLAAALIVAAIVVTAVKKYMPDEIDSLKRLREKKEKDKNGGGFFGGGKKEEPKKMPKIVMPDD